MDFHLPGQLVLSPIAPGNNRIGKALARRFFIAIGKVGNSPPGRIRTGQDRPYLPPI